MELFEMGDCCYMEDDTVLVSPAHANTSSRLPSQRPLNAYPEIGAATGPRCPQS